MNNNAKRWVKALRSGEYKQGKDYLRRDDQFCCLGVACDLAIQAGVPVIADEVHRGEKLKYIRYDGTSTTLPPSVQTWLGLRTATGERRFGSPFGKRDLTELNDGGATFAEIADLIEAEQADLFTA